MHTQFDALAGVLGDTKMLDAVTEVSGAGHIFGGDAADPLGVDLGELQRDTEGDGRQNGQFVGRVDPFHVEGGVRFRVTQLLGFVQHILESTAALFHLGEDKVAGTVDDARQPVDMVGRQPLAQGLEDGDAPGHGGFEGHIHAVVLGRLEDLVAVLGDQRLVGGDNMFAVLDGGEHQLAGGINATDQLHQDIDIRVCGHGENIPGQANALGIAGGVVPARTNVGNFNRTSHAAGNIPRIALENVDGA